MDCLSYGKIYDSILFEIANRYLVHIDRIRGFVGK